jgi:AGCS family alanine or glycine:cation symporter
MSFADWVNRIDGWVWGYFLMFLLVGTGLFLTVRFRFVQIRYFKHGWGLISGKWDDPKDHGEITHFQALSTALSATIGTGNIAGVATAIAAGGPGAVFWMWVTAAVGMCSKFMGSMLSQKFREIDKGGVVAGGPMYYLRDGLKAPVLGWLFALFAAVASFGIGNMVQANSVANPIFDKYLQPMMQESSVFWSIYDVSIEWPKLVIGIILAILVALVIIGGVRRIAKVAERVVPFMTVVYIVSALIIIFVHIEKVPGAFGTIVSGAFGLKSAAGGALGYTVAQAMRFGVARGLFSNESGLGSAAIAHASAKTKEPVREGMVAMLGPFIDTLCVCTMTALVIIISGLHIAGDLDGATLSAAAFDSSLPNFGKHVVSFGLVFFAFTTMVGWSYYGDRSVYFLFGRAGKPAVQVYRWIYVLLIPVGASLSLPLVWNMSDIANGLMAFPNLVALIGLSGLVAKLLRDYENRRPSMTPYGRQRFWFLDWWRQDAPSSQDTDSRQHQ